MKKEKIKVFLDENKIKKTLKIKDVINVVEKGFRRKGLGLVDLPPKRGPKLGISGAFADAMTVSVSNEKKKLEVYGVKWIGGFPDNFKKGLPYLSSLIIINEPECGLPIAVLKGSWITAIRTASVSAVCARYLAPKKNNPTIGIFGLGLQAYVHVLAFKAIYKNPRFLLFNHSDKFVNDFKKKFPKDKFVILKDSHEVVKNSDIILSATTFPKKITPQIFPRDLKDDVLILPIDYATRLDSKIYKHLDEVYTDDIPQYELKSKLRQYFPSSSPKIKKEVGELIAKRYKRGSKSKRILVFNLGIALFDILTAKEFLSKVKS